jgi:PAS domain S-box-containing protein
MAGKLRGGEFPSLAAQLEILTGKPTLLFIDQFEQVLAIRDAAERSTFLEVVLAQQSTEDHGLRIVCTLRADFLDELLHHPGSGSWLQERLWTLSPMAVEGLERVIIEPAQAREVSYETGLAKLIARDAAGGGGLPLLQFALTELWPHQQRRTITFSEYHNFGGVSGALSTYAEKVYSTLLERYTEKQIRALMLGLVRTRGGAAEATRLVVTQDSLGDKWGLAEVLAKHRLVVLGYDSTGHTATAELAHEALIRCWPRFEKWVNDDAPFQRWQALMEERALEGDFLSDRSIEEASRWLAERPDEIRAEIRQLVEISKSEINASKERRKSEEAVRRSEERYRTLVQSGAQVVWVAKPTGEIAEDSPDWRVITGQSLEEYLRDGWVAKVEQAGRARVEGLWRECLRTGKIFDTRYRIRTTSGYRHYDVRAVPIERDGQIVEWVGASTDVTAQREAEEMRGRLTEQLSAAALRTARLQQATSMLAEALTVEQVVEVIIEVGRSAIGADRSAVALLDTEWLRVHTVNPGGLPESPGSPGGDIPLDIPSVVTKAINTRRPVLAESPDALRRQFEDDDVGPFLANTDERAWVGMPLMVAGSAIGALRFSFTRLRKINDEERIFLEALAGQCALAVERASLFEREHSTAETLQRSLLPDRLPQVPGIILDAQYLPVTRNMEIGGDWYDAFRLPDGRLAVAVGDVMGKGLSAAAGMGRARNALRALALSDPRPAAVLAGLDRLYSTTELDEQLTTVAYLLIDPTTGAGLAGNAGHPPPLLISHNKQPQFDSTAPGTPLGWAIPREQYSLKLTPGDSIILYSDGLIINRNRGLDEGLHDLVSVTKDVAPEVARDPAKLLKHLVYRMLAGYEQDDDVVVLVLQLSPSS